MSRAVNVAVLAGGRSSERAVSLESARAVLDGLEAAGHHCRPIVIDAEGVWWLQDPRADDAGSGASGGAVELTPGRGLLDADVAFPVLHGPFGEDGTVQGLLECADVPYVGAGVLASALCMDKAIFKRLMSEAGLPQVRHQLVVETQWRSDPGSVLDGIRALGMPQFVKPARLGSSVGITKVSTIDQLPAALQAAFEHDSRVLVEAAVEGKEVECAVIGDEQPLASEPGEIVAHADWYDYEAKYSEEGMELIVPAQITGAQHGRVRRLAIEAFRQSMCSGMARVDFFVAEQGQVLVNELNTIPGFTSTSVFAKLFEASGLPYVELLDRLLGHALERHERERRHRF